MPGHADVLIFGLSGSGKSSLIRTFYMALHKTQQARSASACNPASCAFQVPADFSDRSHSSHGIRMTFNESLDGERGEPDRIIVKDTAMNEGTLKYVSAARDQDTRAVRGTFPGDQAGEAGPSW